MSFKVVSVITGDGTAASVIYLGIGAGIVTHGVSGRDLALDVSMWITGPWFIFVVDWSHSVWVVVIDVGMLGLVYRGIGSGTVAPGVSCHDIAFTTSTWRTGPWFLVVMPWIHSVWVVVMDVGMLGFMLVWVG